MKNADFIRKTKKIKTFGNSMFPLLHEGDILYMKRIKFSSIKVNDILCMNKNGRNFTHRVIYKSNTYLISKGDGNYFSDGRIYERNILGRVWKIKRGNQYFNHEDIYLLQSTIYFNEIRKIGKALKINRISTLVLKGLPLHLYYQGDHPKRYYGDCDILIDKTDLNNTIKTFESLGYKLYDDSLSKIQKKLKDTDHEISFIKYVKGFPVVFDVHLEPVFMMIKIGNMDKLYPNSLLDQMGKNFMNEKRKVLVRGEVTQILSPENLFIYLCLHLYHHNFKGTYRYDFIESVFKREDLDYHKMIKLIKDYKLTNFIYPSLKLLSRYYHLNFPNFFIKNLEPKKTTKKYLDEKISKINIFDDEDRITSGIERFKLLLMLSPNIFIKKVLIFLDVQVLNAILLALFIKNKRFVSRLLLIYNHKAQNAKVN